MGTSHRQAPVRDLVGRVRDGPRRALRPARRLRGRARQRRHDRLLGRRRRLARARARPAPHLRRVLAEVRQGDRRRALPRRPDRDRGRARRRPGAGRRPRRRRDRLGPQRDLDRRHGPGRAPRGRGRRPGPDRRHLRAPAACRSTSRQADAYYFAPQKAFAADGGLWLALLSPAAIARIEELDGADDRWQPAFLSLQTALENSRKEQTYNTPALATLLLLADQIEWMLARRRPRLVRRAHRAPPPAHLYGWAEAQRVRHARSSPTRPSARWSSARSTSTTSVDAAALAATLRANGIVDVEPYRKLGRNQLRIGMFPAVEPGRRRGAHRLHRLGRRERRRRRRAR